MLLNRIEPGTICKSLKTGEAGKINKIFFYPTKYEVEFSDGRIEHYSSKDLKFEGIEQKQVSLKLPEVPENGVGESWCEWVPFKSESYVEHHFSSSKEIIWEMLTSLEMYNVWFHGIQRALPEVDSDRFVHKYSFSKLELKPGAYFKIRPMTIAPWFRCRIMTYEKEKEFGFTFQTNPFNVEFVQFSMNETKSGVWVRCNRKSEGLFSILDQMNWQEKSKILQKLDQIVPKISNEDSDESETSSVQSDMQFGGFASKQDYINYAINMGMNGDMDYVNAIPEKTIRGMAKAGMVKSKRTGQLPPLPEKVEGGSVATQSSGGFDSLSKEDKVAYLVNKGLDGDMDAVNNCEDKIIRGKAKAMIVKINRGSVERPAMPNIDAQPAIDANTSGGFESLSKDDKVAFLVNKGLDGDMDAVNNCEDKIIRGKAKAMIVKIKRGSLEKPAMPSIDSQPQAQSNIESETDAQKIERLIAKGLEGDMDEINALDNRVMRGKIKAAIVKAKRSSK